ncbi:unnamed protein product [Protopolystoma xenopodis]|uniref:Uncharacterized protein n=1 Tax=Protopolystoma xenopodis TaxID=117903 RepID=A0A448WQ76_9PLAT|nr:unnamed protein product [Protopolystoma xenopodis]
MNTESKELGDPGDKDCDGIPDEIDEDMDNDGMLDRTQDSDWDGTLNWVDDDDDDDGEFTIFTSSDRFCEKNLLPFRVKVFGEEIRRSIPPEDNGGFLLTSCRLALLEDNADAVSKVISFDFGEKVLSFRPPHDQYHQSKVSSLQPNSR